MAKKLFSKQQKENYFQSEANMFDSKTTVFKAKANISDSKKIILEAKRRESFDNDVFFDIEAKQTRSIVGKFISKWSEHVYIKEFKNRSGANTFDSLKIYFEAKRTCLY